MDLDRWKLYILFLIEEGMLDLSQELVSNYGLLVDSDAGSSEDRGILSSKRGVDLGQGHALQLLLLVFLFLLLNRHLALFPIFFKAIFNPAEEDQIELPNIFLISYRQLIAVIINY